MPELLATFRGPVSCRRAHGPLGLTLDGITAERPGEPTTLAFTAAAPSDLPDMLEGALIEHLGAGEYRITSSAGAWRIAAPAVHLHRDIAAAFYRAVPPRPAPWGKRAFWGALLALAASRAGLAALRALRR
jgi:hypothetical protein